MLSLLLLLLFLLFLVPGATALRSELMPNAARRASATEYPGYRRRLAIERVTIRLETHGQSTFSRVATCASRGRV